IVISQNDDVPDELHQFIKQLWKAIVQISRLKQTAKNENARKYPKHPSEENSSQTSAIERSLKQGLSTAAIPREEMPFMKNKKGRIREQAVTPKNRSPNDQTTGKAASDSSVSPERTNMTHVAKAIANLRESIYKHHAK